MDLQYENLLGKDWVPNEEDCFTLGIDFFKQNFDIDIPNIARPKDWNSNTLDLIGLMYPRCGFNLIQQEDAWGNLRPADVLAMSINSTNANHFAIYVGDNEIIHHRYDRTSCKELLRPYWRMSTLYILRHPEVPDLRPELPTTTLEEILRARLSGQAY